MAKSKKKVSGTAKPGSLVTRRVSKGPGKGDTVLFRANSASAQKPGKLIPQVVIKDRGKKNTQSTLARGKKAASKIRANARAKK